MKERIRPTRSGLFAIELVAAVGAFTLCAAICTGIFVQSELMSQDSADLSRAVNEARNAAERFKASGGDLARMAERFGGEIAQEDGKAVLYADGAEAAFQIRLSPGAESPGCVPARLEAVRQDGTILLEWEIAALSEEAAP